MNDVDVLPKDHNETVALFRLQAIGPLLCRDFSGHGELAEAVRTLAQEPVRPPGQELTRHYSATATSVGTTLTRSTALPACDPNRAAKAMHLA